MKPKAGSLIPNKIDKFYLDTHQKEKIGGGRCKLPVSEIPGSDAASLLQVSAS
jgi:hypothetical protein